MHGLALRVQPLGLRVGLGRSWSLTSSLLHLSFFIVPPSMRLSSPPASSRAPFTDYVSTVPDDRSAYSLATVHDTPSMNSQTSLLSNHSEVNYGTAPPSQPSSRRLLWNATLKMATIFLLSTAFLGGTLWLALPTLEECVLSKSGINRTRHLTVHDPGKTGRCSRFPRVLLSCRLSIFCSRSTGTSTHTASSSVM